MKVAIITGAGTGIGRATALQLAKAGWALVLNGRREQPLQEVATEARNLGSPKVEVVPGSIDEAETATKLALAAGSLGADQVCLVNNAGFAEFAPVTEQEFARIESQILTNFLGTVRVTHAALPLLLASKGRLVNVLSIAAKHTFPGAAAYGGAKAGATHFFNSLRAEVRGQGVIVTNLFPGATDTPIWDQAGFKPPAEDMLPPEAVADAIVAALCAPADRSVDEVVIMPPKGNL